METKSPLDSAPNQLSEKPLAENDAASIPPCEQGGPNTDHASPSSVVDKGNLFKRLFRRPIRVRRTLTTFALLATAISGYVALRTYQTQQASEYLKQFREISINYDSLSISLLGGIDFHKVVSDTQKSHSQFATLQWLEKKISGELIAQDYIVLIRASFYCGYSSEIQSYFDTAIRLSRDESITRQIRVLLDGAEIFDFIDIELAEPYWDIAGSRIENMQENIPKWDRVNLKQRYYLAQARRSALRNDEKRCRSYYDLAKECYTGRIDDRESWVRMIESMEQDIQTMFFSGTIPAWHPSGAWVVRRPDKEGVLRRQYVQELTEREQEEYRRVHADTGFRARP